MLTLTATDARNRFFELLNLSKYRGEEFIVEKNGVPMVRLTPIPLKNPWSNTENILSRIRTIFDPAKKKTTWSVLNTRTWKKMEHTYLETLSEGGLRGADRS